ncbi:hypothetical protein F4779DRAFT_193756 [Xylariaceae sp. FL0662B]|nr:hypothetical protein F4779DRAFT_193756 [Xylariaceae sp. FL0662B]
MPQPSTPRVSKKAVKPRKRVASGGPARRRKAAAAGKRKAAGASLQVNHNEQPACDRCRGYVNMKGEFVCEEVDERDGSKCMSVMKNAVKNITSHFSSLHLHGSAYIKNDSTDTRYRCRNCGKINDNFHRYVRHLRSKHGVTDSSAEYKDDKIPG